MPAEVHVLGIRHHGPGSARQLVRALDALRPSDVLIEGPADASELIPLLADPGMEPPVALLTYPIGAPDEAAFWPFARFSPEYQAARWALHHGAGVRFIDLPASHRQAVASEADTSAGPHDASPVAAPPSADGDAEGDEPDAPSGLRIRDDPIGALARAAGYEDGESWWRDVIEENPAPGSIFASIADAMATLRGDALPDDAVEIAREAHMRLEIARVAKSADGPVAVVCGAWHVPALTARHTQKDDRARLRSAKKEKVAATWVPWTSPRLALHSGYGAGVVSPGWCGHLWDWPADRVVARWLARTSALLRSRGHAVSTASVIEAHRLGVALAALRGRPAPGFEELRDAAVACLCLGEVLLWGSIAAELLIGAEVGSIPASVPLAPLLEDLARQQKRTRLRPEALERELSLDLRSESGLLRSTLLHRLAILEVPWGREVDAGRSRGTFRERWVLQWEPEYAVQLVENLVYGPTIEQAASARLASALAAAPDLRELALGVHAALTAQLPSAAASGIDRLGRRIAQTSDAVELLLALPSLVDVLRYGQARTIDTEQLGALARRIAVQAAVALPHATRNLDDEAARALRGAVERADAAIRVSELGSDETERWNESLAQVVDDAQTSHLVSGCAARLLYEAEQMSPEDAGELLSRMLSPGSPVVEAAAFFEGFLEGAGHRLIHDAALRHTVDAWLTSLEEETFIAHLPLVRRVFSSLDRTERRHLRDAVLGRGERGLSGLEPAPGADALWARHLARIAPILTRDEPTDG